MDPGAGIHDALTEMLKERPRGMLQAALEAEVPDHVNLHAAALDNDGRRVRESPQFGPPSPQRRA